MYDEKYIVEIDFNKIGNVEPLRAAGQVAQSQVINSSKISLSKAGEIATLANAIGNSRRFRLPNLKAKLNTLSIPSKKSGGLGSFGRKEISNAKKATEYSKQISNLSSEDGYINELEKTNRDLLDKLGNQAQQIEGLKKIESQFNKQNIEKLNRQNQFKENFPEIGMENISREGREASFKSDLYGGVGALEPIPGKTPGKLNYEKLPKPLKNRLESGIAGVPGMPQEKYLGKPISEIPTEFMKQQTPILGEGQGVSENQTPGSITRGDFNKTPPLIFPKGKIEFSIAAHDPDPSNQLDDAHLGIPKGMKKVSKSQDKNKHDENIDAVIKMLEKLNPPGQ